jgi:glycosyltransferase involved in cell wall biosynthesis
VESPPLALEGSTADWVELDAELESVASVRETLRMVRRENIKALFISDGGALSPAFPLLRLAGVRGIVVQAIASGARTAPRGLKRLAKWLLIRSPFSATQVAAASEFVRILAIESALFPPARVTRVWNGVEIPPIRPDADLRTRKEFGLSPTRPLVASVSRASPEKGISYLLRAFDSVWREWREGQEKPALIYVGDGPEFDELKALREGLPSSDAILMPGYIADAISVLDGADVFVSPSIADDAFPYAVIEPMARGRLVVGTWTGGIPEQIEDGVSGVLVPARDEDALSMALSRALSDPGFRERLGREARRRVSELFSVENQVERICSVLLAELGRTRIRKLDPVGTYVSNPSAAQASGDG